MCQLKYLTLKKDPFKAIFANLCVLNQYVKIKGTLGLVIVKCSFGL